MLPPKSHLGCLALLLGWLAGCGGQDLKQGLAGTWLVTRTLVTPVEGLPNGYYDQQEWTFTVSGEGSTLSTKDGSVGGSWNGGSWVFATSYTDPRFGVPAQLSIEIIGVDPLKGTLENKLLDPTGLRPPTLEGFTLEGTRLR